MTALWDTVQANREWSIPLVLYVLGGITSSAVSGWRGSKLLEDFLRLGSDWSFLGFSICAALFLDQGSRLSMRAGAGRWDAIEYMLFPFVMYIVAFSLFDKMRNRTPIRGRRWPGWSFVFEFVGSHAVGLLMLMYAWSAIQ
jgi:hypothetical protein